MEYSIEQGKKLHFRFLNTRKTPGTAGRHILDPALHPRGSVLLRIIHLTSNQTLILTLEVFGLTVL